MSGKDHVVCGVRTVEKVIAAGHPLLKIYFRKGFLDKRLKELHRKALSAGLIPSYVPDQKLDAFAGPGHQGVGAEISPVVFHPLEELVTRAFESCGSADVPAAPLFLLLDRITDVRNLGAIARSAEVLGADGLVIPLSHSAQVTRDAVTTSSGAVLRLPISTVKGAEEAVGIFQEAGVRVLAADQKADSLIYETELRGPLSLILGSEHLGVSTRVVSSSDGSFRIPMVGKTGSLNVSVAASLCLYEAMRQRHFEKIKPQ